jgi:hypothetical protein
MRIPERARLGVAVLVVVGCAVAGGAAAGCAGSTEPAVTISAVTPAVAYSDDKIPIVIQGGPFRPVYDIDTSGGQETTELGAFTAFLAPSSGGEGGVAADSLRWLSTSELAAELHPGIAAGSYDVEVRDPRGALARLGAGFVSLGSDKDNPVVTIDEPLAGAIVNAGAEVPVAFRADDGFGYLSSMDFIVTSSDVLLSGTCPQLAPNVHQATCRFLFVVPKPMQNGQPLNVIVTAHDTATNSQRAETTLAVGVAPVVATFGPFEGPSTGGTQLSVMGDDFITGTQVLVGGSLLQPNGGTVVSASLIQGTTPQHDPGLATVTVRTGALSIDLSSSFDFVGQPEVRALTPTSGRPAGCTPITIVGKFFRDVPLTRIWFGADGSSASQLRCPVYVSQNRIEGFTPPGAGAVAVFAQDPAGGIGMLPLAFTYLDPDAADAGAAAPPACPCAAGPP